MKKIFHHIILFSSIIILLISSISHAQTPIQGIVVGIADGDTITVLQDHKQYKIRLYGVDTPEKRQDFGQKAKQFTSDMVFNKAVKVIPIDIDRYKRIVGMVYINGTCLNEELIKNGYAWVYRKYCNKSFCDNWSVYEKNARESRLGLWSMDNPVPPWDYRKGSAKKQSKTVNVQEYHGNLNSNVFHAPWCKHFNCKNCKKVFQNRESAIKAGYRPCGNCKP